MATSTFLTLARSRRNAASLALLGSLWATAATAQLGETTVRAVPDQPRAETAFVLEISSVCCSGPARVVDATVEVVDDVVRVDTTTDCGPLSVITAYDYSVVVPPIPAGQYTVEVQADGIAGSCPGPDQPEVAGAVTVADTAALEGLRCKPSVEPAATLLFPYFEVDPESADGVTTLLAITNTRAEPVLANVTLWSNWALPVADFEVYLSGADVQTLNLRDVLAGNLPVTGPGPSPADEIPGPIELPGCDPSNVAGTGFSPGFVLSALRGESIDFACWARPLPSGHVTGFVTVDVVQECSDLLPGDDGYFVAGGTGVAGYANALVGDFFLVEPEESFAQGETAVHVVADPSTFGPGTATFYGDLAATGGSDARMPLGRVQAVRFLQNPGFDGGTELLVWRDVKAHLGGPISCGLPNPTPVTWLYSNAFIEAFDEAENRAFVTAGRQVAELFPLATQRMPVSSLVPWDSGWLRMDLLDQSAVTAVMRGLGRFSVGVSASQLDDPCPSGN